MTKKVIVNKLQSLVKELYEASNNNNELSKKRGNGFSESHYDELHGIALAFQWDAEKIADIITEILSE